MTSIDRATLEKSKTKPKFTVQEYDIISYSQGLDEQNKHHRTVLDGGNPVLMLLQHKQVITLGRRTDPSHLLLSEDELLSKGIELFNVNRGGSATYHGPGQLVGYIICKSNLYGGIHNLVSIVLKSINEVIQDLGIASRIDFENPGVWTDTSLPRKLSAVGMSNSGGVTMHGFAINVDLPLTGFSAIVPCGLSLPVSTLAIETGKRYAVSEVAGLVKLKLLSALETN